MTVFKTPTPPTLPPEHPPPSPALPRNTGSQLWGGTVELTGPRLVSQNFHHRAAAAATGQEPPRKFCQNESVWMQIKENAQTFWGNVFFLLFGSKRGQTGRAFKGHCVTFAEIRFQGRTERGSALCMFSCSLSSAKSKQCIYTVCWPLEGGHLVSQLALKIDHLVLPQLPSELQDQQKKD